MQRKKNRQENNGNQISDEDADACKKTEGLDDMYRGCCQGKKPHSSGNACHKTGQGHVPDGDEQGFAFGQSFSQFFIITVKQVDGVGDSIDEQKTGNHIVDHIDLLMTQGHETEQKDDAGDHRGLPVRQQPPL